MAFIIGSFLFSLSDSYLIHMLSRCGPPMTKGRDRIAYDCSLSDNIPFLMPAFLSLISLMLRHGMTPAWMIRKTSLMEMIAIVLDWPSEGLFHFVAGPRNRAADQFITERPVICDQWSKRLTLYTRSYLSPTPICVMMERRGLSQDDLADEPLLPDPASRRMFVPCIMYAM